MNFWNAVRPWRVEAPKKPGESESQYPRSVSRICIKKTSAPVLFSLRTSPVSGSAVGVGAGAGATVVVGAGATIVVVVVVSGVVLVVVSCDGVAEAVVAPTQRKVPSVARAIAVDTRAVLTADLSWFMGRDRTGYSCPGSSFTSSESIRAGCHVARPNVEYLYRSQMERAATLGQLIESGWSSRSLKTELRENAVARIAAGEALVPAVLGYEDTVIPQLETAILAGHDVVLLGERGQAKTRLARGLVGLLDEWMPIVAGSEVHDDPFAPISKYAQDLLAEYGNETAISWVHRDRRYGEKLATPDTTIADLIGEVDPIKIAEGRYLSDELTLHFGLVPRTNRGIFAINELPDLAERIQVGLLNVLEERDIQIRGFTVRLPLDVMLIATANPEDYTNRGRLITPLKDRFGSQIRTHYPLDIETECEILLQESLAFPSDLVEIDVPEFMTEVVATMSHLARQSSQISQRSGVSVRLSISNHETMIAAAVRRCLRSGEALAVPRISDLASLVASTAGKVEIDTFEEGKGGQIIENLIRGAVLTVFRERVDASMLAEVVDAFDGRDPVAVGEDVPSSELCALAGSIPALQKVATTLVGENSTPAALASAVEFILDGLHCSKRLNKDGRGSKAQYRAR
jgi:magnesium chelatase subunit I